MRFAALCILALSVALTSAPVSAQWVENGVRLTTSSVSEYVPRAVSDGAGGAIVAWYDDSNRIMAQRIDPYGRALWTAGGVVVCGASGIRSDAQLAPDGSGGAIVAWKDSRSGNLDIYAQRLNASGAAQWWANGVAVCTQTATQRNQKIVSDGAGGAIVAWQDYRSGNYDIYAQRLNAGGAAQWTANGVAVCVAAAEQMEIQLLPRPLGGAFVVWYDLRSGSGDLYYDILFADGSCAFTPSGNALTATPSNEGWPRIAENGLGGIFVAWTDNSGVDGNINIQKITSSGSPLWAAGGLTICAAAGNQLPARIAYDGAYGAIVAWSDYRYSYTAAEIFAQRVNQSGVPLWMADGVPVTMTGEGVETPEIVPDGRGGAILAWIDYRYEDGEILSQKLDEGGNAKWGTNGTPVCVAGEAQFGPCLVCDGDAGAVVAWYDYRGGLYADIYAQRIERNGYWGYPAPLVADVRDVPGDQGGAVDVAWDASRLDDWYDQLVSSYSVWRAIDHTAALELAAAGAVVVDGPSKIDPSSLAPVIRVERTGASTFYWKLVSTVYASYLDSYSETVATLFDSTAASDEYHYFQVIANGTWQGQYWISPPDSGYSVDNLAPEAPVGLVGEQIYTPAGLELAWRPNLESDLAGYAIYRGTSAGFVPGPGNLVASTPDTLYLDGSWSWDGGYYYKVAAIDIHGNESGYALLSPDGVTGVDASKTPAASYLAQNFPNPFNPSTRISFGLAAPARVSLRIYDASGRLVRVMIDAARPAGAFAEIWDGRDSRGANVASGIYFYRLEAGAFSQTRKMVLLK